MNEMKQLAGYELRQMIETGLQHFVFSGNGKCLFSKSNMDRAMPIADVLEDIAEAKIRLDEVAKQLRAAHVALTR